MNIKDRMSQLYNLSDNDPEKIEAFLNMPYYRYLELLEIWVKQQHKNKADNANRRNSNRVHGRI